MHSPAVPYLVSLVLATSFAGAAQAQEQSIKGVPVDPESGLHVEKPKSRYAGVTAIEPGLAGAIGEAFAVHSKIRQERAAGKNWDSKSLCAALVTAQNHIKTAAEGVTDLSDPMFKGVDGAIQDSIDACANVHVAHRTGRHMGLGR